MMYLKRWLLLVVFLYLAACQKSNTDIINKYNIGIVSYGESDKTLRKYNELQNYLGRELSSAIELEPTFNEIRALQQIRTKKWDIVFAPPGLAAIAISQHGYQPVIPLEGIDRTRSVIGLWTNSKMIRDENSRI